MRTWITSTALAVVMGATVGLPAAALELKVLAPNGFTPASTETNVYQELYKEFEAENPDITISFEVLPGGSEAIQRILAASGSKTLPDVAILDGFWLARLVETGDLQPLDEFWNAEARAKFSTGAVEATHIKDHYYAVWFYNAYRGLFYRPSLLKSLGFDAPPANFDEALAMGKVAREKGVDLMVLPGMEHEGTMLHFLSMYWGLGGEIIDSEGKPNFFEEPNRSKFLEAVNVYKTLVDSGYMRADVATLNEEGIRPYFYANEALFAAQSSSYVPTLRKEVPTLVGDMAVTGYPLPGGAEAVPILVGWTYGIFATDTERKAAAWKFIEFMTRADNLGRSNEAQGQLPVVDEIWNRPFYSDPVFQDFRRLTDTPKLRPRPAAPIYPALSAAITSQLSQVIVGTKTPEEAVDAARDIVLEEYERQSSR